MQITYVSLVENERTKRTAEVDAAGAMMLRLLWTVFQMTLYLKSVINPHLTVLESAYLYEQLAYYLPHCCRFSGSQCRVNIFMSLSEKLSSTP